jgi:L-aspartate oxidase
VCLGALGLVFYRDPDATVARARHGGHGAARVVHAGGDATGAACVRALLARARGAAHIRFDAGLDADALLLRGGRVCGVRAVDRAGRHHEIEAAAVVLATGGLGALFARTSNPPGADGAGLALAMAAGARARDLEFVQFHPTALAVPGHCLPLLTEALRGAAAVLRDAAGRRLMAGVHPLGDLAPRDVVARQVWQARDPVLDARALADDFASRFPTVLAACRAHGFDPRDTPLPVTPAAHFHMGGIHVDADGATSLPGLFAVGEVACSGVHGANRLASNSLLEGVACGRRLGVKLAARGLLLPAGPSRWIERGAALPAASLSRLREVLWLAAGPLRDGETLRRAMDEGLAWQAQGWQARVVVALLAAPWRRRDSLGAHHRTDSMRQRMAGAA